MLFRSWEITNDDHSPWVRVLRAKYLSNHAINNPWSSKGACSRTWAACKAAKPLLDKGLRKVIHTGISTSFWSDTWCSLGPVRSIFFGPLNVHEEDKMVCDFIDSNGCWNWESLSFSPPQSFIDIIQAIPINLTSPLGDTTAWSLSRDGNFNLASAYLLAKGLNALNLPTFTSNWIWKMKVP